MTCYDVSAVWVDDDVCVVWVGGVYAVWAQICIKPG